MMKSGNKSHGSVAKAKDFKGSLLRLLSYLGPKSKQLFAVILLNIISTIFSVIAPKFVGRVTTFLFAGVATGTFDFNSIINTLLWLTAFYILSALFSYFAQYVMADVAQQTVFNLRKEVDHKLSKLPLKYIDGHSTGDLLSRVTNDIDNISTTLQQSLTQIITSVITIIGVIVMMLTINPVLTLIVLITLPLGAVLSRPIIKRSQSYFLNQQTQLGLLNGHVEEAYTGHTVIKAFNQENQSMRKFTELNDSLYEVSVKAQFVSGLIMPIMSLASNLGYVFIAVLGGQYVISGKISVGDIQAFIQYTRQFMQPINQVANIANILQSTVASAERVFEILDAENEVPEEVAPDSISNPKGQVSFDHVKFGYDPNKPLMQNISFIAHAGQTVAVVGPTGAGKTTLINLLMRFYEIQDGSINIDGIDITKLRRGDLRNLFGMVLQDTWLFKGSIKDNIGYSKENASLEEIKAAAKAAFADQFIETLPDGYDTLINEEGSNISQGQKQLLTIARAILANPTILILDEATSNVDTRTEGHIQKAMNRLMEGRTSFVIAHRLSTIKNADMILVMKQGTIIEKGTHEELLAESGLYANLYNSQFA
ncbi:ABC transporter ATP-binding protein [Cellulosilyticum ruminicola]|uniref:ABC transporter ATP-binding protein n=1 Tax=Cellulosilyticum ruminicola TaxID=425254 RepID=UPI0006D2C455|nr:ABC transporter ATP-binding protein [Cellulosilyticum ruminicola]